MVVTKTIRGNTFSFVIDLNATTAFTNNNGKETILCVLRCGQSSEVFTVFTEDCF